MLRDSPNAQLVDVRSEAELTFVGVPDLSSLGKPLITVPWQLYPGMVANRDFAADLEAKGLRRDQPLYFLCRSGGRSRAAAQAMTAVGFHKCFNVMGGFEGDLDSRKHRGGRLGWKAEGLPWQQQ
jgi:rhodanese-related sulfurtransferase